VFEASSRVYFYKRGIASEITSKWAFKNYKGFSGLRVSDTIKGTWQPKYEKKSLQASHQNS
jgi:hypothetical protein